MTATNRLTIAIINYLRYKGFFVWRNNTVGIYDPVQGIYRENPHTLKGVSDIIGFRVSDALFVGVEVKFGKDKLSADQSIFLSKLQEAGGIAIVAKSLDNVICEIEKLEKPDNSEKKRFLETVYRALQIGRIEKDMPLSVWNRVLL